MRLIDADKLIEKLRDFKEWENDEQAQVEYHEWLNGLDN